MITDKNVNSRIVGYYLIDGQSKLGVTNEPNFFRKLFVRFFLGWKYIKI